MSKYLSTVMDILKNSEAAGISGLDAVIEENRFYVPSKDLAVYISIEQEKESENGCMAVVYFWLSHPSFDEVLFETAAAMSDSLEGAVRNAAMSFYAGIYSCVLEYLEGKASFTYMTDFFGKMKQWNVAESDIVLMGNSNDEISSFWSLIKDWLQNHMGDRSLYYIKVFASRQTAGDIITEVRVNDVASAELAQLIRPHVEKWTNGNFHSRKQFFFISQKTPSSYPHSREKIAEFTKKAALLFGECETDEQYDALVDNIAIAVKDIKLAVELRSFLPEMCAQNHFENGDFVEFIMLNRANEEIKVYKDQFTPYYWISKTLIDAFVEKELPVDLYKKLIINSSIYHTYVQAEKAGEDMANAKPRIQTAMNVPADYVVR